LIGITNEDLVTEKIKDLNRLLKKKNVPKDEGKKLKELRRRLLNRGYANKSRVKKDDTDQALKAENDIFEEINKMSKDRNSALRHYDHNLDQLNFNLNYELEKEIKEFLGKDEENFDMEKFYEDMTDSEDENDYHNDNESVRGRDDYYKEINFVRKVSQNFSWENDERFTYEINKRLEKIKHLKVSNDFNETSTNRLKILEDEKKELTDEEVILQHDLKTKWIKN